MAKKKQLTKILEGKLWKFFGGIKPNPLKNTTKSQIEELPIPSLITLPLERHLGTGGMVLVKPGDYVKTGQVLTIPGGNKNVPLHATTSGHILSIAPQILPHPSGFTGLCVSIKPDGLDEWVEKTPLLDWENKDAFELIAHIRQLGVEGLGGAQFQTATKLAAAISNNDECEVFIINGAECEPVATCDDRLMQERAEDIVQGIEIVKKILKPKVAIIAIEDNKPDAIKSMEKAIEGHDIHLRIIPTVYPSGAARNLIKIVTGIEIPYSAHTADTGIVVDNVETVFAIKQAIIDGIPLIQRVITISGDNLKKQGNAWVRVGTSVRFLLNNYKLTPERRQRIILGGPFMGFTVPSIDVPVTKAVTCVMGPSTDEFESEPEESPCIRCGRCARVCPSRLTPYLMYAYSKVSDHANAKKCGIADCTECGCCSFVCPSKIRLSAQFRKEKAVQRLLAENQKRNEVAKERMKARDERIKQEEIAREKKKQAALMRIKKQQELNNANKEKEEKSFSIKNISPIKADTNIMTINTNHNNKVDTNLELQKRKQEALAQAKARSLAKREAFLQKQKESLEKQNETLKPLNESVDNNATSEEILVKEEPKVLEIPYNLRLGSVPKRAKTIEMWPKATNQFITNTLVENPLKDDEIVPIKTLRKHTYMTHYSGVEEKVETKLPKVLLKKK